MVHFVTMEDVVNGASHDSIAQFTNNPVSSHKCIPECHEIGGESEAEAYRIMPMPLEESFNDGTSERCVSCGGPHFDCTDPGNWD